MTRTSWVTTLVVLALALLVERLVFAESSRKPPPPPRAPEELQRMSTAAETAGLAEPFKGVTSNGQVEPNLFAIRSTGVSTAPIREAAERFIASLTEAQRTATIFATDDVEWRRWMNQSFYVRRGVSFGQMTETQREAAFGLLRAALSAKGLKLSRDIMHLNRTLGELNNDNFTEYNEWLYHITIMGKPSASEPWGWQLDGHHLIVNYFVLGDQVVVTPFFAGSEPVTARAGKYQGTTVLQDEQSKGLALINAFDPAQRARAVLKVSKTGNDNLTEAWKDNVVLDYAGIKATDLSDAQRAQLLELIALYVGNIEDSHARIKMEEVRSQLARTWFSWIGKTEPGSVFYYRIHSPVLLIEFDHQRPANLRHLADDPTIPTAEHIHTIVRTPNGNDYGKDLLRLHYLQHPHDTAR
jgi:Protein of unknown function (DUF3500)